jgi:hypothetical protein
MHPMIQAVRDAARANPENQPVSQYTDLEDGELVPCCIIGTALHTLGVPLSTLAGVDREYDYPTVVEEPVLEIIPGPYPTNLEVAWLRRVQLEQDSFEPWKNAVALADCVCPLPDGAGTWAPEEG